MRFVSLIKRYTSQEGRDDRALLGGIHNWLEKQLIPVAPNRSFDTVIDMPDRDERVACEFTTTSSSLKGEACVEVVVRRASHERTVVTLVLSEREGELRTVNWP